MSFHFSKGHIASLLCFLLGAYLCFAGLHAYFQKNAAIPIDALRREDCKPGTYVYGDIETYLLAEYESALGTAYNGLSTGYVALLGEEMDEYTIPLADDSYIRFWAVAKDTRKALELHTFAQQKHVYIEGRVTRTEFELNDEFYTLCKQFGDVDYHDAVLKDVSIREISFDRQIRKGKNGIIIVIFSIMLFILAGSTKSLVQIPESVVKEGWTKKKPRYSHHTQYELDEERMHLSALYRRLDQMKKGCLYRLPLLLVSVWMVFSSAYGEIKLLGMICLFLSLQTMVQYFLNSNMEAALFLVKLLHRKSVWLEIMESSKRVQILQSLIEEHEASKNQMSGANRSKMS